MRRPFLAALGTAWVIVGAAMVASWGSQTFPWYIQGLLAVSYGCHLIVAATCRVK